MRSNYSKIDLDLILNPVDDYVCEFTKDVPWEAFLKAADICEPAKGSLKGLGSVMADTPVESLLGYLAKHPKGVIVEDKDGATLGTITSSVLLASLANVCDARPAEVKQ